MKLNWIQKRLYLKYIDERIEMLKERQKREMDSMINLRKRIMENKI